MKKINEDASTGATSAGSIASCPQTLNFTLKRPVPPLNLFKGMKDVKKDKK